MKKQITLGVLAHVDAGKTTLSESILYLTGSIRKLGRVDHKDAFLDTYALERARGITIFSKQARFGLGEYDVTLLDTPGHVDFSAEMERTLQVLDCAILVISGADGVQGHVETLWRLLKRYEIPVFLFVNKMDQDGTDRQQLMDELKKRLDSRCVDFTADRTRQGHTEGNKDSLPWLQTAASEEEIAAWQEELAMCDEALLEQYLEGEAIDEEQISRLIAARQVFPCYFGSALKVQGVEELLAGLSRYMVTPQYSAAFGARVYKISRDSQGTRLTHLKITGGSLRVKALLSGEAAGEHWEEKVDQIRLYSGAGFTPVDEVRAGGICAVTGLTKSYSGQGLGCEAAAEMPLLEPVLTYRVELPEGCDVHGMLTKLRQLEEEEPQLHIVWNEALSEIHAQVMGEVQIEILKNMIAERYGVEVEFGSGSIVYKETIAGPVEGIGHYEPLRHYAEVHLLMEPGEPGSGLQFDTACSEDVLDRNWQRLILTHLEEKKHVGVLTGSEITDMKITVVAGKAHLKHTEGGDFRQSTYRAVRHGLMKAHCVLLEPVYEFRLEVPTESLGRAMTDIQRMNGSFQSPDMDGDMGVLEGTVPVATMQNYGREVTAYTRGRGQLFCRLKGYELCHNAEEVIATRGYDPEADLDNPAGSVFCAYGAGYVVPWELVDSYAHVDSGLRLGNEGIGWAEWTEGWSGYPTETTAPVSTPSYDTMVSDDKELEAIFERTYGPVKKKGAFDGSEYKGTRRWNGSVNDGASDSGNGGGRAVDSSIRRPAKKGGQTEAAREAREAYFAKKAPANKTPANKTPQEEYLLVDGYNIIFAWEELNELSKLDMEAARGKLMDILSDYQGYRKMTVILVFDAYKVEGGVGEVMKYHNIYVVFTKEAETADQYIEKTVHRIGRDHMVTVATSDALEQVIILGAGARRMSAPELWEEIQLTRQEIRKEHLKSSAGAKNYLFDHLDEDLARQMEQIRLGHQEGYQEAEPKKN